MKTHEPHSDLIFMQQPHFILRAVTPTKTSFRFNFPSWHYITQPQAQNRAAAFYNLHIFYIEGLLESRGFANTWRLARLLKRTHPQPNSWNIECGFQRHLAKSEKLTMKKFFASSSARFFFRPYRGRRVLRTIFESRKESWVAWCIVASRNAVDVV